MEIDDHTQVTSQQNNTDNNAATYSTNQLEDGVPEHSKHKNETLSVIEIPEQPDENVIGQENDNPAISALVSMEIDDHTQVTSQQNNTDNNAATYSTNQLEDGVPEHSKHKNETLSVIEIPEQPDENVIEQENDNPAISALVSMEIDDHTQVTNITDNHCHVCFGEVSGAHKCISCLRAVHVFCGVGIGDEGYGQAVKCFKCQDTGHKQYDENVNSSSTSDNLFHLNASGSDPNLEEVSHSSSDEYVPETDDDEGKDSESEDDDEYAFQGTC
ncbi:Hypothetical predicted protein [Paramuricea clavata]|uniref:SCAN domain-containing protein n=1 Tax=Paramuricea clavata TaxID=317549 RepID=A0A7D9DLI1_PARCT|nr:Hypothetical predicted protein [Paramuricea clavata]